MIGYGVVHVASFLRDTFNERFTISQYTLAVKGFLFANQVGLTTERYQSYKSWMVSRS